MVSTKPYISTSNKGLATFGGSMFGEQKPVSNAGAHLIGGSKTQVMFHRTDQGAGHNSSDK